MNDIFSTNLLAALIAMKPMSYLIRLVLAGVAFGAAMNPDKVIARVIGLAASYWRRIIDGGNRKWHRGRCDSWARGRRCSSLFSVAHALLD